MLVRVVASSPVSEHFDQVFTAQHPATLGQAWDWGLIIHNVQASYLSQKVDEFKWRVDQMIHTCMQTPWRP